MNNSKYAYNIKHPKKLKAVVGSIQDAEDLSHFLRDLRDFLNERADDFKSDMETRDNNEKLIDLLEYCSTQSQAQDTAVSWLRFSQR